MLRLKKILYFLIFLLILCSCKNENKDNIVSNALDKTDSLKIVMHLERMVQNDQSIQMVHKPDETLFIRDSLFREQEKVFKANTDSLKDLFKDYGFLGIEQVGKEGAHNFWLLVQHSDNDIQFQLEILRVMETEMMRNNASSKNYAYLTDRVLINQGKHQKYGTQIMFTNDLWAVPSAIQDSVNIDVRRQKIGLPPLNEYLNRAMNMHFEMNKSIYYDKGLNAPRKYIEI